MTRAELSEKNAALKRALERYAMQGDVARRAEDFSLAQGCYQEAARLAGEIELNRKVKPE